MRLVMRLANCVSLKYSWLSLNLLSMSFLRLDWFFLRIDWFVSCKSNRIQTYSDSFSTTFFRFICNIATAKRGIAIFLLAPMFYRLMPMNTTPYIIYILLLVALAGCAVLSMLCLRYKREADMLRENTCPADDVPVAHDVTPLPEPMEISSADEEKNVLLLAEDDLVMRSYLEQALAAEYRLVSVSDGAEALAKAKEVNPDIIIADIMMTALKGDELCRTLKSSVDTSHIPVVLLTALGEREDIIYGLEAGADDYIIKPFDLSVLKARLRIVLQNRQRFRSAVLLMEKDEEDIDYSSQLDKEFLDKVMGIINQEMSNSDFSINDFCRMMGMSRTSIYNKLKTLTGQGPQDFIRIMRLNKAKELLKTRRHTIGEVSALVGYSDPKYFSTCFKKQFGVSPSKI